MNKKYLSGFAIQPFLLILTLLLIQLPVQGQSKKILVIGVDGIIHTALDYATTPGIDRLLSEASYSMSGNGGLPAFSQTGWATMLTGVTPDKHNAIQKGSFQGNRFNQYPSVISRIKKLNPALKVGSVFRDEQINQVLATDADWKFSFGTDQDVAAKASELLGQADLDVLFVQLSNPADIGREVGFQLREARYVLAIQQTDQLVAQLLDRIGTRNTYSSENWAVYLASSHGGTESGEILNSTPEEFTVPIIFSGGGLDRKELVNTAMQPRENSDNVLSFSRAASGDFTWVRVPINGTPLQGMNKFTIEMWIKPDVNSSDPAILGDKDWDSGGNPGFVICRSGNSWKINIANQNRERYDIGPERTIEDGNWHHIAVTFDKTNQCIVYQDGVAWKTEKLAYKPTDTVASPFNFLGIAQEGTGRYGGGAPNWAGVINELRIWTDVVPGDVLRQYMHVRNVERSQHPYLSSLNLYYKFDELRGTLIADASGKGHHGDLIGPAARRFPLFPLQLTDVAVNVLSHLGFRPDAAWGLDGATLKSNVPYRLYKVN